MRIFPSIQKWPSSLQLKTSDKGIGWGKGWGRDMFGNQLHRRHNGSRKSVRAEEESTCAHQRKEQG